MNNAVILLVDDEISILKSLKRVLFEFPYEIIAVSSSKEAKEYLVVHNVDMIISDFKMPIESGLELLSFVRDEYPDVIRIMLSGYVEKEAILESLFSCAALSFFPKPWDDVKLTDRITELLEIKQNITDPDLWKLINSGKLFGINNSGIKKMNIFKNEVELNDGLLFFLSNNIFILFKVARLFFSDYFKTDSTFELTEAVESIGLDNLFKLCLDIPESQLVKTNVYLILPEIFALYYDDIYKIVSGSEKCDPLKINLPFTYLYNSLLLQTNQKEYLNQIDNFIKTGKKIDSRNMVHKLFKTFLKLCKLPDIFYEQCENNETDKSYPVLAAKKLRDLVELFWWSNSMPEKHTLYTLPEELLEKIYLDVKKLQP